jgi:Protein of unknown function with PCYCGC motif
VRFRAIAGRMSSSVMPVACFHTVKVNGSRVRLLRVAVRISLALLLFGFPLYFLYGGQPDSSHEGKIPAYHSRPPNGQLPRVQPANSFSNQTVRAIYAIAAHIRAVLYQQPCYCRCDRGLHHTCLLDCFVTRHASVCGICLMEAVYAYEQTKKGKTPTEIRREIEKGDWRQIVLSDYTR